LSDEGSGYAIAVEGLRAAARAYDGRGDKTRLADDFAAAFGADNFEQLVLRVYDRADDRAAIAALAPVVWNAAASGDAPARAVVAQAAEHWADMIRAVAGQLDMAGGPFALALGGGVFSGNPLACPLLAGAHAMKGNDLPSGSITVVDAPVAGAVELAKRLLLHPPGVHTI
jgi:N-acetylglucosamine kinase-like BadF-type ATPase